MYEVYKEGTFSGAHRLREYEGKCEALHGHNWRVRVYARAAELDAAGMVIDFKILQKILNEILDTLDHRYLNEVSPFDKINPSAENIARFFYDHISKKINDNRVTISRIMVWETDTSCAIYEP